MDTNILLPNGAASHAPEQPEGSLHPCIVLSCDALGNFTWSEVPTPFKPGPAVVNLALDFLKANILAQVHHVAALAATQSVQPASADLLAKLQQRAQHRARGA